VFERFSLAQRFLIPPFTGLLFYGFWAFMVNYTHGFGAAFKAGCVQGSYSFVITLGMTLVLEATYRALAKATGWYRTSAMVAVIVCCAPVFIGSWMINVAAGTPEVFRTVILGYVVGFVYSSSYVFGLWKHKKNIAIRSANSSINS